MSKIFIAIFVLLVVLFTPLTLQGNRVEMLVIRVQNYDYEGSWYNSTVLMDKNGTKFVTLSTVSQQKVDTQVQETFFVEFNERTKDIVAISKNQ